MNGNWFVIPKIVFVSLLLLGQIVSSSTTARAEGIIIDTQSARQTLAALTNPKTTKEEATHIAGLGGNQGLVKKHQSYNLPATTEKLANALYAAAHDQAVTDETEKSFGFPEVKAKAPKILALLDQIDSRPTEFQDWVVNRVNQFSPKAAKVGVSGFLIVGGWSGGFSFDEPDFYLNLGYFDDFETAKVIMAHELYHAVQNAFQHKVDKQLVGYDSAKFKGSRSARECLSLQSLFSAFYLEGSASYVGDVMLLSEMGSEKAQKTRGDFSRKLDGEVPMSITLLDLSVIGLTAQNPVPYEDVYAVGFYVPEPLYTLGYVMAKAIAKDRGDAALSSLLPQPSYQFAKQYLALPNYGKDYEHPKLKANTLAAIKRLETSCGLGGT